MATDLVAKLEVGQPQALGSTIPPDRLAVVWSSLWPKLAAIALALASWQVIVWSGWKPDYVLPGPLPVFQRLGERSDRRTICVSTQVGCAYGCKFCASGLDGFSRNLDASEIVQQLLAVEKASGERIDNVVFMGMGEPLANFAHVVRAIRIINAPWGLEIGARHITVSTRTMSF